MHPLLNECKDCNDLQSIYDRIECTLLYLARNKDNSLKYNVSLFFDKTLFNDLKRYKRIIGKRLKQCNYPCDSIKTSDIIAKASFLAFREGKCNQCEDCFPELPTTTTTSTP